MTYNADQNRYEYVAAAPDSLVGHAVMISTAHGGSDNSEVTSADLTGNGIVDVADLMELLGQFGPCPGCCSANLDHNEMVDVSDLLIVLGEWD